MNTAHKCNACNDTGEKNQDGMLDCAAPGCTAATERAKLNSFVACHKNTTNYDLHWAIHQRAMAQAQAHMDAQTLTVGTGRRATDFPTQD